MSLKMSRALIRVLRRLAPAALRDRWAEEWQAEIRHARERLANRRGRSLRLLSFAAGAVPDVIGLHRLPRAVIPGRGPRFHGFGQDLRYAARSLASAKCSPPLWSRASASAWRRWLARTRSSMPVCFRGFPG